MTAKRHDLMGALVAGLAVALGAGLTFRRTTTPWSTLPDFDYWGNIRGLVTEHGLVLELAPLFRHNNEHIVFIPKLVYAANYLLTSGSNIGLIVYSIAMGAACAIILLILARDLLRDTPDRWVFCAVLFPLAMFSAKLSHSYYFGMSGTIWLTADLLVILSLAALAKAAKEGSPAWLLASLLTALLGALTYSTAIYALLVIIIFCFVYLVVPRFRGHIHWTALVAVAVAAVIVLAIWLIYRPHPSGHPAFEFDPIGLAAFVLVYIGSALSEGYWQPVTGVLIFAAAALAIWRLLVVTGRGQDIFLWVALFLFAPFNGLMTGIGRLGFGLQAATSSRYQSVTAISLIAAMALVLAALPSDTSRRSVRIRIACIAALTLAALFLAMNSRSIALYAPRLENKRVAEIALRQGIHGIRHLKASTKATGQITRLVPILRPAGHVPFNTQTRCEAFMGQRLPEPPGPPVGGLETIETYKLFQSEETAIELLGWAVKDGQPAECVAVADGDGIVIGAGVATSLRSDPATGRPLRIGWKGVATNPPSRLACAYALFPGNAVWHPLANCKAPK